MMIAKNSSARIRVGIIGLYVGEAALKGFQKLPQVEVLALAGLEEERLTSLGTTYAVPHLYRHYEDLLTREDLDAISIAVPNALHAPIALKALSQGLHVLCEKPLASTLAEAEAMVEAATQANRVLQVIFNHRQRTDVQTLKRVIDEGQLGTIYYAKVSWMRRRGIPGSSWFMSKRMSGGGPLIDLGIHVLDMALFLLGEPTAVTVSASTYSELSRCSADFQMCGHSSEIEHVFEVEDLATAFIRLSNGTTLLLETSWATHGNAQDDYEIVLYGTKGGASIHAHNGNAENALTIYTDIAGTPAEIRPNVRGEGRHDAVTRQFVERIKSGQWKSHNGSEGLSRSRIIEACYASAAQQREMLIGGPDINSPIDSAKGLVNKAKSATILR
ncbi:oxidoreductase [Ktedonobacter sp. SOSP1-85]|uniref:Gfo/Idh/MocA family protein n=1 Tax=Ktedonobacter sp. SOSP1-85 TaxID=2778367 RepID=UPI001A1FC2A6|nr:Gfo/Idh/MocA family oxidoreductase [Ktedonobacter sp. SOSP1-85]GHO80096.1 oxidoreductase [Ktedonobacter sp. SOSP1-85]